MQSYSKLESITTREKKLLCQTYGRYPIHVLKAYGSRILDSNGKEYIDLLSGLAVTSLGHCNEEIAELIKKQAKKLIHVSNLLYHDEQLELAERLLSMGHFTKVFFCNSGAEANETSIKLARRYMQKEKHRNAFEIIILEGSFHGRTLASLAATGQPLLQEGFGPMPQGFKQVSWDNLTALEEAITPQTAAILIEVIQGEGGVRPVSRDYLLGIKHLCRKHDILLIVDEIQTGLCRTGKHWSFQHFPILPDILSSAKALANGLPIGAMLTTDDISRAFTLGSHGTTFGGGPLVSSVASKTLEIMQRDNLDKRSAQLGTRFINKLQTIATRHPSKIKEVRGMGLMVGIILQFPGKKMWEQLLEHGFILNLTQGNILRLLPALTIDESDLEAFSNVLEIILETYVEE